MYSRIQALKEQGFSKRQVSRIVRVARNTISKYWEMEPSAYAETYQAVHRMTALMAYEPVVVKWLETYPCMTAAQARDWLEERYQLDVADRTMRRFVAKLREEYGITKVSEPRREYEAVDELPKGYQLQLDFGEKTVRDAYSSRYIKLYFVVFALSYSRYKWGVFQDRPFLSADLVRALYGCFDYLGGMPRQLVYDQDSIIVVSENSGDIIHTQAFSAFLAESKLEVRVCRKSDPESKGLIEASVKFVKRNFMENRLYMGIDIWNQSFEDWLVRTAETVEAYKSLIQEEQAFRNMKTVRLEIRPIYHKTDERIKCHIFICMLAYNVMWHMKQRLRPLFEADGVGTNRKYTFDYVIEILKSIRKETVEVCGAKSSLITTPNEEQNRILKLLNVKV